MRSVPNQQWLSYSLGNSYRCIPGSSAPCRPLVPNGQVGVAFPAAPATSSPLPHCQLRPRNSRRYVIYFARQQSNNLSIDQIISFFDRQSPLSKPSCLDLPIYRAVPRTAHHSSQSASLPTWTIPSTQATKPPADDTSAPRSVTHQENLAPGRSYTAEPRDRQATPRTYAVVFLRPAIVTQASHILCFGAFTNAPKQRVCWYMMCAAHFCTITWIRVNPNLCILFCSVWPLRIRPRWCYYFVWL